MAPQPVLKTSDPVCVVAGTRPEVIKLASVVQALVHARIPCRLILTAQQRALALQHARAFGMRCDHFVGVRHEEGSARLEPELQAGVHDALKRVAPRLVLVQGDTTTAVAAAQAACDLGIPTGHVEAGLRTHCLEEPKPEEEHRRRLAGLAHLHFCPSPLAQRNLLAEGIAAPRTFLVGQTGLDPVLAALAEGKHETAMATLPAEVRTLADARTRLVLLTLHRREGLGGGLAAVCRGVGCVAAGDPDLHVVVPRHPNPRVAGEVAAALKGFPRVHVVRGLSFLETLLLLGRAALVVTDSGGLQEEAPLFGRPVVVARNCTERPEVVEQGFGLLAGRDEEKVAAAVTALLARSEGLPRVSLYGDGQAGRHITDVLTGRETTPPPWRHPVPVPRAGTT